MDIFSRIKTSWNYRYGLLKFDIIRNFLHKPKILSIEDTVNYLLSTGSSLARFGDGEVELLYGTSLGFQAGNSKLSKALEAVLNSDLSNLALGLPSTLSSYGFVNKKVASFWRKHLARTYKKWYKLIRRDKIYCDAFISRFHTIALDEEQETAHLQHVQMLWEGRDVVMVEGEFSRLGVGNDCFKNARSVKRILCPAENAFDKYDEILAVVTENVAKDKLLIMALGPTATVLAYDLAKLGYQALDMGHIDIEYEWWRMKAVGKAPVRGKYNNEARIKGRQSSAVEGDLTEEEWSQYESEIICKILYSKNSSC